ncbi:hypothetical protein FNF27_05798 [Cafeteria roenbergensis]|uniref:Uncharacterized protein n=1 Tax=Cafeteria roenbergensis TaxID=33653 RepID=A0A5A8E5T8_CAFRO|nr:hypothetical protein FNF27_05798 [Cafeteria roenbergensis]
MRAVSAGALALLLLGVLASARDSAFRAERRGARTGSSQQTLGPVEGIAKAIAGVAAAITGNAGASDESEAQHEAKAAQDEAVSSNPLRLRSMSARSSRSAALRAGLQAALPAHLPRDEASCPPPGAALTPAEAAAYPPACGLSTSNVTRDVRIGYREWLLPFTASPTTDKAFAPTSSDPRPHLAPEDVVRIADERPLDQDATSAMVPSGLALLHGFPGPTGETLPVWGTNLERLPAFCSVERGSARVRTSKDARPALRDGDTVVLSQQLDGRVVVAGSISEEGFDLAEPVTRFTGEALPCWRVVPGKGPRSQVLPPDLGGVIASIKGEADAEFGGAGIDGALLPGLLLPTRDQTKVGTTEDLRPYLFPLAVLRVGPTYPHVVAPAPGVRSDALNILARWRPDSAKLPGYLTGYRVLPGLASAVRGRRCMKVTSDVRTILGPGDVIMVDRTARLVVAFSRPSGKAARGELLEGDGPTVTADTVCLSHPYQGETAENRAWFFHDGRRLVPPAVMRLAVTPGSADAVPVGADGKPGPDPRGTLVAGDELKLFCDGADDDVAGFVEPRTVWSTARRVIVAGEDTAPVTRHGIALSEPFEDASAADSSSSGSGLQGAAASLLQADATALATTGAPAGAGGGKPLVCLVLREGRRLLPGTATVTHGTAVYETSADLRDLLAAGDVIQAGIYRETAVAGGTAPSAAMTGVAGDVRLPVARSTLQTLAAHEGKTEAKLTLAAKDYRRLPCNVSVVHGSKEITTLCDMTDVLLGVGTLRVGVYRRLTMGDPVGLTPTTALLRVPYPGPTRKDVPAYASTRDAGPSSAFEDVAYGRLPGCAHVIHGSPYITTTSDLTQFVTVGDALRIGTRRLLVVASPPAPRSIRLTVPWPGPTAQCLPTSRMYRRLELPGRLDCSEGQPDCVTSQDTRGAVAVGEVIVIVSRSSASGAQPRVSEATGTPLAPNEREYTVVTPFTDRALTLSEAYTGPTEKAMPAYRVLFGSGAGVLLPGHVAVSKGSPYARTSEDVSGSVRAGERLRIGLREFTAVEPITPSGLTLSEAYPGTTADGLKAFNLGRTQRQASLEALAALKLRCRSIYCLAKIEQLERGTPSDLTRSLTAGKAPRAVLAALASDQSAVPYVPTPEEYARGAFTADATTKAILASDEDDREDVEREWQRWFRDAASTARKDEAAADAASQERELGGAASGLPPPHLFEPGGKLTEQDAADGAEARVAETWGKPERP